MQKSRVDFSYSFGMPHRITVALPDSSSKTIIDVHKDRLSMRWTYGDLLSIPPLAYMALGSDWQADFWPEIDGKRIGTPSYSRADGFLPVIQCTYKDKNGTVRIEIVGGSSAAIARIDAENTSNKFHRFGLKFEVQKGGHGEVPGYVEEGEPLDYVTAGWHERADRILAIALGGEHPRLTSQTIAIEWDLKPGEKASGWLVRPYSAYAADAKKLRKKDWAAEFERGKAAWHKLLNRAVKIEIPDEGVANAFYAALADNFIMREPASGGYIGSCPGTEGYRCPGSGEGAISAINLDQTGLHKEAEIGFQISVDARDPDGCWADTRGWGHRWWSASGFKSWAVMEHYKLTGGRAYLEKIYPTMLASSKWQEKQRAKTRVMEKEKRPLTYGLMPRGVGDCGLDAGDRWYGVFYAHNIWSVYADKMSLQAAGILGKTKDVPALRRIYKRAHADLIKSLREGSMVEGDYRWIPGSPSNPAGSRWGALNAAFPCGLLDVHDPLITGTLRYMNTLLSSGGLQMNTGWMKNGMWVAISLDNVAEVELARGNADEFARLLYACLNHGTPLYSWCEERADEPGTTEIAGDRQHLFTPVAIVRAVRDALVMEDGEGLHLARGTDREWLASGGPIGIEKAPTHFGKVSFEMKFDKKSSRVTGSVSFPGNKKMKWATLHIRLPKGLKVTSAGDSCEVLTDGSGVKWNNPRGLKELNIKISKE